MPKSGKLSDINLCEIQVYAMPSHATFVALEFENQAQQNSNRCASIISRFSPFFRFKSIIAFWFIVSVNFIFIK